MISLNDLLSSISLPPLSHNFAIEGITLDSRKVGKNYLFAALPGTQHDGRQFIQQALQKGAIAILLPEGTPWEIEQNCIPIYHPNPRLALAKIAAAFYRILPHHKIAITGTNGKTSTADFIRQLWNLQHLKAASIGTLGVLNNAHYLYEGPVLTTPDTILIHEILQALALKEVNHVAMEASSHGLAQYRLDEIELQAAGFTNLTRDHLDYHANFDAYFQAKQRLFKTILPKGNIAALNADMDPDILSKLQEITQQRQHLLRLVGEKGDYIRLDAVIPLPQGQNIYLTTQQARKFSIKLPLLGRYQIDNILLALALIAQDDKHLHELIPLLPFLKGVKGRMEQAAILPNGATIYVDYAHTPDAIAHLLQSLQPHVQNKLHIIFGAGGDRDKGKRPLMAKEAGKYADNVIITDDNPRTEDPAQIRQDVKKGFMLASEIGNREEAIAQTLKKLQSGDILVVAGKGHEQGQTIGTTTHPFDDVRIIQKHAGIL